MPRRLPSASVSECARYHARRVRLLAVATWKRYRLNELTLVLMAMSVIAAAALHVPPAGEAQNAYQSIQPSTLGSPANPYAQPTFYAQTTPEQIIRPEGVSPDGSLPPTLERLPPLNVPPAAAPAPPWQPPLDRNSVIEEPPVVDPAMRPSRSRQLVRQIFEDHGNYYSKRTLRLYAMTFGLASVAANTSIDQHFRNWYQDDIGRNPFIHSFKYFGEGVIVIPSYVAATVVGRYFDERPAGHWLGEWGQRSLRTVLVGGPPMLLMQFVTGGSRPGEQPYNSAWHPFQDVNSVSGHSFMGAIPFLTAAHLTDRPLLKATLYAGSTMTGWSRVNDDAHYLSQIFLGWWMAYAASIAVDQTNTERSFEITPIGTPGIHGWSIEWRR